MQHETCRVSGCSFTAAPKLVQFHYNMVIKLMEPTNYGFCLASLIGYLPGNMGL